jgi:hypothetical protein
MKSFATKVCGIPCLVQITAWEKHRPGRIYGPPEHCYPDEGGYGTWELLDRRGRPAPWLEKKLTDKEINRIEDEVYEHAEVQKDY